MRTRFGFGLTMVLLGMTALAIQGLAYTSVARQMIVEPVAGFLLTIVGLTMMVLSARDDQR